MNPRPAIYPTPMQMELRDVCFDVDENVRILLPTEADECDLFLARLLMAELVDCHQVGVRMEEAERVPEGEPFVVMGTEGNPLVRRLCQQRGASVSSSDPGREGYALDVDGGGVLVAGSDAAGAFYGLQSLRQLIGRRDGRLVIQGAKVRDCPHKPFRGLRLYLPGRENSAFFKRLVRDFAAFFKYNTLVLEMNAAMRLDRHPELNAGWFEFAKSLNYTRRSRPEGPGRQFQDSAHHDTGDFAVIEKEEVADLVSFARRHQMEVVPEIPSLTHAYYLLTRHRELAEIQKAEWPDAFCPLEPEAYELYFDVLDEYIEVLQPKTIHIGHDEWRMPMGVCPKCRDRDYRELFVEDVRKIHEYLTSRGIRTAMWGDHLLESVRGVERRDAVSPGGYEYRMPGGLRPEQVVEEIPKDILILNWFWNTAKKPEYERNDVQLEEWGFEQVYGNFTPQIVAQGYERRSARPSVLGGAPSAWAMTCEPVFGKDIMYTFVGCAGLLWSRKWHGPSELTGVVQSLMPDIRRRLHGASTPLEDGEKVAALDIGSACSCGPDLGEGFRLRSGKVEVDGAVFELPGDGDALFSVSVGTRGVEGTDLVAVSAPIEVGLDPSSLVFLHACARAAGNAEGHFQIYNFDDTADLLGWYEVTYADGFVAVIPIRYGVNIAEWTWAQERRSGALCYAAAPVDCAAEGTAPVAFFAHEWVNPRFGKVIREVRLKGSRDFIDAHGRPIESNAVVLLAVSVVEKRPGPESAYGSEDF